MTKEDKKLLLADLCARFPYGVKIKRINCPINLSVTGILGGYVHHTPFYVGGNIEINTSIIEEVKPYLRPMSSMTEEEFLEYHNIKYNKVTYRDNWKRIDIGKFQNVGIIPIEEYLDWLNEHHFDYRGLIEKGFALEAPEGMYKN